MRINKPPQAFTIVEMLTVILVVMVLAALTLGSTGYVMKKAGRARAQAQLALLQSCLENYHADNGDYPRGNIVPEFVAAGYPEKYFTEYLWAVSKVPADLAPPPNGKVGTRDGFHMMYSSFIHTVRRAPFYIGA